MLKHPVFLVLLGFVLGFGVQYLLPKSAPESVVQPQPVAQPETPNVESTSTEPITQSTEKIETPTITGEEKKCPTPQVGDAQSAVPCPCLYSDKILDPPEYQSNLPEELVTNFEGEVMVRWKEVIGAKRYQVAVLTEAGEKVKEYKTSKTLLYLKDIPLPRGKFDAHYILKLQTVNGKDELGPLGLAKKLYVKPMASVVAPEVQEIKVED